MTKMGGFDLELDTMLVVSLRKSVRPQDLSHAVYAHMRCAGNEKNSVGLILVAKLALNRDFQVVISLLVGKQGSCFREKPTFGDAQDRLSPFVLSDDVRPNSQEMDVSHERNPGGTIETPAPPGRV